MSAPPSPVCVVESSTPGIVHTGNEDPGRVRLIVSNPGTEPLTCRGIDLTVPVGTGPTDLAADPKTLVLAESPDGWTLTHAGEDRFRLVAAHETPLLPGQPMVLGLDGVGRGTEVGLGQFEALVRAELAGRVLEPVTERFDLYSTSATQWIEYFKSDAQSVVNEDGKRSTTLRWKGLPQSPKRPTYRLHQSGKAPVDVTPLMDKQTGEGSKSTGELFSATGFSLVAEGKEGSETVVQGVTIAVMVVKPDLTVGKLTASGVVRMLTSPQTVISGTKTEAAGGTYRAATDGFVTGTVQPTEDGDRAYFDAIVTTTVTENNVPRQVSQRSSVTARKDAPGNLLVPVPQGSTVTLTTRVSGTEYEAQVTWYPMGLTQSLKPTD